MIEGFRVLLKFVREGSVVKCENPDIVLSNIPNVGDLLFVNVAVNGGTIKINNDEEKSGFKIKPFKVCQIMHSSHILFGELKSYDAIITLNTEYLDVIKITEEINNSHNHDREPENKKRNKLT
tara:strand:+ start:93 stop:461 length:369 start_codon:yes stop_codon:yes gene_type:complete